MFVPFADFDYASIVVGVVGLVLGGGFYGALIALRKGGAESESITIGSAILVNKELRGEITRLIAVLAEERAAAEDWRGRFVAASRDIDALRSELRDHEDRLDESGR